MSAKRDGSAVSTTTANASGATNAAGSTGPSRWDVGLTAALVAGGAGLLTGQPAVFLSAAVGLSYAGYRFATRPPKLDFVVERELSDRSPAPGAVVSVTLSLTNEADSPVADLRVVDGVPEGLEVVAGSPRCCTSLQPDETALVEYDVRARRGVHEFGDAVVVARNVSGGSEARESRSVPTTLTCRADVEHVPLTGQTATASGRVSTAVGGEGLEFYSTRKHHPTDPMNRVDWKRYARTGELTTVDFREERAATVVVVVDTRPPAHVVRRENEPDAVWLSCAGAERVTETLLKQSNRVGAALYGPEESYLSPGTGGDQALQTRALFDTIVPPEKRAEFSYRRKRNREWGLSKLLKQLPRDAQVVFFSPLVDDEPTAALRRLRAHGHSVTVVAPSVAGSSLGGKIAALDRRRRLGDLRSRGVRVVDWSPDEPLQVALSRAQERWSP